jgi:CspA family cold shock protein
VAYVLGVIAAGPRGAKSVHAGAFGLRRLKPFFDVWLAFHAARACRLGGNTRLSRNISMSITGTVKFFNTTKGFGFITPDAGGKDIFVHATAVEQAGMRALSEGQRVSFEVQPDARGSKAVNLSAA